MFRASPWISYGPTRNEMDVDVDMDAPQISTLREDESPPPAQARVSKFRVKLRVNETGTSGASGATPHKQELVGESDDDEDELEDEEEEDQLADDDDMPLSSVPTPAPAVTPTRGVAASKRGQIKGKGRGKGRGKVDMPEPGPMMTWFEVSPSNTQDAKGSPHKIVETGTGSTGQSTPVPPTKPPRKKAVRKGISPQKPGRKIGSKAFKSVLQEHEDPGSISEAFPGTTTSSPLIRDINTPEFDAISAEGHSISHLPSIDDHSIDGVPLPIYPLPSKPFLVQPLPKIGSGFAPSLPLDKSGAKVRPWREAHREIRGIAGGRWFTRTWVGEKESEYASVLFAASASATQVHGSTVAGEKGKDKEKPGFSTVSLPKLPTGAMPTSSGGKGKSGKSKFGRADGGSTAATSRSTSAVPDIHIIRPPSKMRNILAAPALEDQDNIEGGPTQS